MAHMHVHTCCITCWHFAFRPMSPSLLQYFRVMAIRWNRWKPTAWKHAHQQVLILPPSSFSWFTCSFSWSSNGSQYRQKSLSSADSSPSCLVRRITSDRLHCAVICPSMDRELLLAETEMPLQPVEMLTVRLREPLPWRHVPQKVKSKSFSLEAEEDKRRHTTIKAGFMFDFTNSFKTHSVEIRNVHTLTCREDDEKDEHKLQAICQSRRLHWEQLPFWNKENETRLLKKEEEISNAFVKEEIYTLFLHGPREQSVED